MKKIIVSLSVMAVVAGVIIGATSAYFSDTETSTGNTFTAGTLDIEMNDFMSWAFPFEGMAPGDSTGKQRQIITWSNDNIKPDHLEFRVTTHSFVDGTFEDLPASIADDFKKQIQVVQFYLHDAGPGGYENLLKASLVDKSADGDSAFYSLYDLEAAGVMDDISMTDYVDNVQLRMEFKLHEDAGNNIQGDGIMIDFEVGAAQVAGQDVL
jgi:predicted ribosomally synthesized peptide with SipW-like signal peptide